MNDVINVAQNLGTERASEPETLKSIFEAKFSEALKTVGKNSILSNYTKQDVNLEMKF